MQTRAGSLSNLLSRNLPISGRRFLLINNVAISPIQTRYVHLPFTTTADISNVVWEGGVHAPNSYVPNILEHWHPYLEIILTLKGHAIHYIDGRPLTTHPSSVFVVNPGFICHFLPSTFRAHPGTAAYHPHSTCGGTPQRAPTLRLANGHTWSLRRAASRDRPFH